MSKNEIINGQVSIFEPGSLHNTQVVERFGEYDVPATYGKPGSYMGIAERAGHLILALDAMSKRNSRKGFSLASYTQDYSAPIWLRYQENTEAVIDGASRNRNRYQRQLRENFWQATGFAAMRGQRMMREKQINPRAQKWWDDFNELYGHPTKLKERNKYKKALKAQLKHLVHVQDSEIAA